MTNYWNHNSAYHPELLSAVQRPDSRVLDVGCGDGLLVQRLSVVAGQVTGIDPDPSSAAKARDRLVGTENTEIIVGEFLDESNLGGRQFDLITCVATLHHMPLAPALGRMRELLAPGGELRIVGLSANKSTADCLIAGGLLFPVRMMSRLHSETNYPGMVTMPPAESLAEIRRVAAKILPGSRVRRRFYYRYTATWTKPVAA